ncbi:hypothetical protein PENTCL1PPCAC_23990, partial [Pristionchus entomophagus]
IDCFFSVDIRKRARRQVLFLLESHFPRLRGGVSRPYVIPISCDSNLVPKTGFEDATALTGSRFDIARQMKRSIRCSVTSMLILREHQTFCF